MSLKFLRNVKRPKAKRDAQLALTGKEDHKADAKLAAAQREKILAPYRNRIDKYVLCFSDERLRYPGGGSYGTQRGWAKRFIEEYLVANGELPYGEHDIKVQGYSAPKHDFSDL